jgi:acyl-CoA synthetase (AMP-forming)/AMP-acid ligase II
MMYGNGLRPDVWVSFRDRFGIREICEMFGSTEGVIVMINSVKGDFLANAVGHHGAILRHKHDNLYIPIAIDHDTGEPVRDPATGFCSRVPYSTGGEIIVAIPNRQAFVGYYKNQQATEKRFLTDVFEKGDLYYRCGDALRRDDEGRWFFQDRLGDTFRWRSENVSTAEVSEVLGRVPGVIDANVYGVSVPHHDGRAGCAALLLEESVMQQMETDGFRALLDHARRDLPNYAVPVFLRIVSEPRMNHTHKQSKTGLRDEGVDPEKVGMSETEDRIYVLRGEQYVKFERRDWEDLVGGRARL